MGQAASPRRALVPISLEAARLVLGPNPTREQLQYHWASFGSVFEKVSITWFGPLILAYLADGAIIGPIQATVAGTMAATYFVWGPAVAAYSRGSLLVTRSSSAALFFGQISAVEESVDDSNARILELVIDDGTPQVRFIIWAPWKSEYEAIDVGKPACLLVLRAGYGPFAKTNLVSECYLPGEGLYFGEYPDLNRQEFELLISSVAEEHPGIVLSDAGPDAGD